MNPTFLYDYPLPLSPLAKKKSPDSKWVERFQLVMGGLEIGNAFTELNDPVDQFERFQSQNEARLAGDQEAHTFDRSYIEAMKFGLPPTGGLGMGIDRLTMLITGKESIREVLLFPQLRKRDDA
jgi:lysyl-tRNA synthetase class 2